MAATPPVTETTVPMPNLSCWTLSPAWSSSGGRSGSYGRLGLPCLALPRPALPLSCDPPAVAYPATPNASSTLLTGVSTASS